MTFDTVHGGWACGQTKAFGRWFWHLVPGDSVELVPSPKTEEEFDAKRAGNWPSDPRVDFQVAMHEIGFLVVRGGVIEAWSERAVADLQRFSNRGWPLDPDEAVAEHVPMVYVPDPRDTTHEERPRTVQECAARCRICAAVRDGDQARIKEALETRDRL